MPPRRRILVVGLSYPFEPRQSLLEASSCPGSYWTHLPPTQQHGSGPEAALGGCDRLRSVAVAPPPLPAPSSGCIPQCVGMRLRRPGSPRKGQQGRQSRAHCVPPRAMAASGDALDDDFVAGDASVGDSGSESLESDAEEAGGLSLLSRAGAESRAAAHTASAGRKRQRSVVNDNVESELGGGVEESAADGGESGTEGAEDAEKQARKRARGKMLRVRSGGLGPAYVAAPSPPRRRRKSSSGRRRRSALMRTTTPRTPPSSASRGASSATTCGSGTWGAGARRCRRWRCGIGPCHSSLSA